MPKPSNPKLSDEEMQQLRDAMKDVAPPSIGLIGVSGVGKSSTINSMFKTSLHVSHTVAGTKKFEKTNLSLEMKSGELKGNKINLQVIDAPGLGENIILDPEYLDMYEKNLPNCDVILWVLSARNRAVALDQQYLDRLKKFHKKMVFGINQTDIIHPMDWNHKINLPSDEMMDNINEICKDREEKLSLITNTSVKIVPYSATYGYNFSKLFRVLIDTIPQERKWIFGSLKNFSWEDFLPAELKNNATNINSDNNIRKPKMDSSVMSDETQSFFESLSVFLEKIGIKKIVKEIENKNKKEN